MLYNASLTVEAGRLVSEHSGQHWGLGTSHPAAWPGDDPGQSHLRSQRGRGSADSAKTEMTPTAGLAVVVRRPGEGCLMRGQGSRSVIV